MKKMISAAMLVFAIWCSNAASVVEPRFVKVSDHCYVIQLKESGKNVAAIITNDGSLLINPPQEPDLSAVVQALKPVSSKAVRWVVFTEPGLLPHSGAPFFAEQNPLFLASVKHRALFDKSENKGIGTNEALSSSWLIFDRQMRLFPSDLEIRIFAVQHKARSGGDIVVFVPAEKVLFVGMLYEAARYPDIDTASEGSAVGWFDGMKQAIDSVPILKSAIPQVKPDPKLDKDKKPEEFITVISSRGDASNLQNMKDLLDSSQKLRSEVVRMVKRGRNCSDFLASSASNPYRSYANLDAFAAQLFAETK
jgi:hypothetical protein